jgi:outer membrane cobalamin receptor
MKTIYLAIMFTALVSSHLVWAEEDRDDQTRQGEEQSKPVFKVMVTAPPVLQTNEINRYSNRVSSIGESQIRDLNAHDLSTALRRLPGLVNSRYNLIGSYGGADGGAVFVRGHGSGRPGAEITTLTGGIPRFVGVWTHPLLDHMSVDATESISVYRSAQPVLLGNMAFAAVDLSPRRRQQPGFGGRFTSSLGQHNTMLQRLQAGFNRAGADGTLLAAYRSSDGHRPNSDGAVLNLYGTLGYELSSSWSVSGLVNYSDGWANDPGISGQAQLPRTERFGTESRFYLATLQHRGQRTRSELKLYYDDGSIDWRQWDRALSAPYDTLTWYDNYGLRLRHTAELWDGGELVVGYDHDIYGGEFCQRRDGRCGEMIGLSFRNSAPYFMVSHSFGSGTKLIPSFGLRYNSSRYFGNDLGWQTGLTLDLDQTQVYANYAHAFNLPGVYAAANYQQWGRGDQWRSLRPERMDHYEVGLVRNLNRWLQLDLSLFDDRVQDGLRFVAPPPPPPSFANIGNYRARGLEWTIRAEPLLNLGLFAGGAYSVSRPQNVPNLPTWSWTGGATYNPAPRWRLSADAQWLDRRYVLNPRYAQAQAEVESFFLLNSRLGYQVTQSERRPVEIFLAGENLTNQRYEFRPGYPMPLRLWALGLDLGF